MTGHGNHPDDSPRREDDNSRKVHEGWHGTDPYQVSGYYGKMTGQERHPTEGHAVTSWEEGGKHVGLVEAEQPAYGGVDVTSYAAGPYRTQLRAQVAAGSLSNRVAGEAGRAPSSRTENFRYGTTHWTQAELEYDG